MLHIALVDTALELVPKSFENLPAVKNNIQKLGNVGKLLDTTLHHTFMNQLADHERRGRPDILHHFLLDTLGSPANLKGNLAIYIQISDIFYEVAQVMRCPRDYHRFKGLMVQLLEIGHLPEKPPFFIHKREEYFATWVASYFEPTSVLKLTSKGTSTPLSAVFPSGLSSSEDILVLIGGFQAGSYRSPISLIKGQEIALGSQGYDSWIVVQRLLTAYETVIGLL